MKKGLILLTVLAGMASCNRDECHECHYENANDEEVSIGIKCNEELAEAEQNGHTVDSTTYEVHCEEH